jgi:hypothetical protein
MENFPLRLYSQRRQLCLHELRKSNNQGCGQQLGGRWFFATHSPRIRQFLAEIALNARD